MRTCGVTRDIRSNFRNWLTLSRKVLLATFAELYRWSDITINRCVAILWTREEIIKSI